MKDNKLEIGDIVTWEQYGTRIGKVIKIDPDGGMCNVKIINQEYEGRLVTDRSGQSKTGHILYSVYLLPPEEAVMLRLEGKL